MMDNDQKLLWETYQQLNEDLNSQDVLKAVLQLFSDLQKNQKTNDMIDERLKQILDATNREQWFQSARILNDPEQLTDAQIEQEFVDMNWYSNDRKIIVQKMHNIFDSVNPPGDDNIQPGDSGLGSLDDYPDKYI